MDSLKLSLIVFCAVALAGSVNAQNRAIRDFIKTHRQGEENVAVKVPGWLIGLAGDVGATFTEDADEKALLRMATEFGTVQVVTYLEEDFQHPGDQVDNFLFSLERYHDYARWADLRTADGALVRLSARQRDDTIRRLVAVVEEEGRTTVAFIRAHLTAEELGAFINELATAE